MTIVQLYSSKKLKLDWSIFSVWLMSIIILAFSFYQQYINKVEPCSLCKWQRFVYLLIFITSSFALNERFKFSVKIILNLLFLIGLSLATYHLSVQFGWSSDRCMMTQSISTMNDYMHMLEQAKVSCAPIAWKLFGWSIVVYNIFLSLFALLILNRNLLKFFGYKPKV